MDIFKKLREARELLGYSQIEAANLASLKQKDVSMLENGQKKFIPESYIMFLYNEGVDINSIYNPAELTAKRLENAVQTPTSDTPIDTLKDTIYTNTPNLKQSYGTKYTAKSDPPTDPPTHENRYIKGQLALSDIERLLNEVLTRVSVTEARISDIYTLLAKQK